MTLSLVLLWAAVFVLALAFCDFLVVLLAWVCAALLFVYLGAIGACVAVFCAAGDLLAALLRSSPRR